MFSKLFNSKSLLNDLPFYTPKLWEDPSFASFEPEATDPYILRQLSEAINSVVHTDENVPKGFDALRTVANLAVNGETEATKRAAILELVAWIRRVSYINSTLSHIVKDMSTEIGNKSADFPQAKELSDACKAIYDDHMGGISAGVRRMNELVFTTDLSEILGIKQFIRDQVDSFMPKTDAK